jgi:hypothetical protein
MFSQRARRIATGAFLAITGSVSTAFAGACIEEGAGNRENVRHYQQTSASQATRILNGANASEVLFGESSINISNVIHRVNDYFISQLGINGNILQQQANGALSDSQIRLRSRGSLTDSYISDFPSGFQGVVGELNNTGRIQNYGFSLGVLTEKFIQDLEATFSGNDQAIQIINQWRDANAELSGLAESACDIEQRQSAPPSNLGTALGQGMMDGMALGLGRYFWDGLEASEFWSQLPPTLFSFRDRGIYDLNRGGVDMSDTTYSGSFEILNDIYNVWNDTSALLPKLEQMTDTQASWYLTALPSFIVDYPHLVDVPNLRANNVQAYNAYVAIDEVRIEVTNHLNTSNSLYSSVLGGGSQDRREEAAEFAQRDPAIPEGLKEAAVEGLRNGSWQIYSVLAVKAQIEALRELNDPDLNRAMQLLEERVQTVIPMIERQTGYSFDNLRRIDYRHDAAPDRAPVQQRAQGPQGGTMPA